MSNQIQDIQKNILLAEEIITNLDLLDDTAIINQLSSVKIEFDGVQVQLPDSDATVSGLLTNIHADKIHLKLEKIVQDALAYYSIADQPLGENEPAIGPVFAQQLIHNLRNHSVDLMQIKDSLHQHLEQQPRSKNDPRKNNRTDF